MTILISTSTGKISYRIDVKSVREKMKSGRLTRKTLQLAALEYISQSLTRRIPDLLEKERYSIRFKGLFT